MSPLRLTGLIAQSLLYVGSGINHFVHAGFYLKIMPDHYAHPGALVQLSGVFEILGGLGLLLPFTRRFSAAGIMAMLVVFFDVHIFMLQHAGRFADVPLGALWVRIPLQFALIWWAWTYARQDAAE
jgi:uncharacterized membrane protein